MLGDRTLDGGELRFRLGEAVGSDEVDLADLGTAGALLRYRAARDGVVVFERDGAFDRRRRRYLTTIVGRPDGSLAASPAHDTCVLPQHHTVPFDRRAQYPSASAAISTMWVAPGIMRTLPASVRVLSGEPQVTMPPLLVRPYTLSGVQ